MNEQNEQPEQPEQPLTLDDAALKLGISRDAVRMRINRGRLRGSHAGGAWLVYLSGEQAERTELNSPNKRTNNEQPVRSMFTPDAIRIAALERERDALAADKAWLQAQVESRGVELAEMRRLLGNAQQQLDGMVRALPAPLVVDATEGHQMPVTPLDGGEQPNAASMPAAIEKAARKAGLGKKQRRKLLDRISGLLGITRA